MGLDPLPGAAVLAGADLVGAGADEQCPVLGQRMEVADRAGHGDLAGLAGLSRIGHVDDPNLPPEQAGRDQHPALHEADGADIALATGEISDLGDPCQRAFAVGCEDHEVDGVLRGVLGPRRPGGGDHGERIADLAERELAHRRPVDDPRALIARRLAVGEGELVHRGLPVIEAESVPVDRVDPDARADRHLVEPGVERVARGEDRRGNRFEGPGQHRERDHRGHGDAGERVGHVDPFAGNQRRRVRAGPLPIGDPVGGLRQGDGSPVPVQRLGDRRRRGGQHEAEVGHVGCGDKADLAVH